MTVPGRADAAGGDNLNAVRRDRMSKGWPQDAGTAGADPDAAQGINQWPGANPTTVRQASTRDYQTYETVPGQQHHVTHRGQVVGYVQRYNDPGHGPLWSAVLADPVARRAPHIRQTQRGFTHVSDAVGHVTGVHRDVAQIENSGVWRPGPPGSGPNLPGH